MKKYLVCLLIGSAMIRSGYAQQTKLEAAVRQVIRSKQATIGVAVLGPGMNSPLLIEGEHRFPMQSVFKLPLALTVLQQVDAGKLQLDQRITIGKKDLQHTFSKIREKYPDGGILTLEDLLSAMVSFSDNNACDILFRIIGGPEKVTAFIRAQGIQDIDIVADEAGMSAAWPVQYQNYSTPGAMLELLEKLHSGSMLSAKSNAFLLNIMTAGPTGPQRLKAGLPQGTALAHKTGTSMTWNGLTAAVNDAGLVTLPGNRHFSIVVFVSDSREKAAVNEAVIAAVAKCAWDNFTLHP